MPENWENNGTGLGEAIRDLTGQVVAFRWIVLIVGAFWIWYRQVVRNSVHLSNPVVGLNILFLALIAFLPFPADALGRTGVSRSSMSRFAANIATAGRTTPSGR